jgi:hypothetical protein
MTKFILSPCGTLLNIDYVEKIGIERPVPAYIGEHFIAAYTKDGRVWKLSAGYRERDRQELHELLTEFGSLITTPPSGVFIFNPEYLVQQKAIRERGESISLATRANKILEQIQQNYPWVSFELLTKPWDELISVSTRVNTLFGVKGIKYVGDIVCRSKRVLLTIPNFGRTSLCELTDELKRYGLELNMLSKSEWEIVKEHLLCNSETTKENQ